MEKTINLQTVQMSEVEAEAYMRALAAKLLETGFCPVERRALEIAGAWYIVKWYAEALPVIQAPATYPELYDNVIMDWDAMQERNPRPFVVKLTGTRVLHDDRDCITRLGLNLDDPTMLTQENGLRLDKLTRS